MENDRTACRSIRMCVLSEPFWVYSFRVECRLKNNPTSALDPFFARGDHLPPGFPRLRMVHPLPGSGEALLAQCPREEAHPPVRKAWRPPQSHGLRAPLLFRRGHRSLPYWLCRSTQSSFSPSGASRASDGSASAPLLVGRTPRPKGGGPGGLGCSGASGSGTPRARGGTRDPGGRRPADRPSPFASGPCRDGGVQPADDERGTQSACQERAGEASLAHAPHPRSRGSRPIGVTNVPWGSRRPSCRDVRRMSAWPNGSVRLDERHRSPS